MAVIRQRFVMVDKATGEELPGLPVYRQTRTKVRGWFMTWEAGMERLASDPDMTGESFRVFCKMAANLDYENYIKITQKEISESLGIRKQHVSRAVKLLVNKGIIIKGPKSGMSNTYRLNEFYGWKGKIKNMPKAKAT